MSTITRREFLSQSAVACGTLAATGVLGDTAPARRSPNLLFVFPDQMRGSAMGFLHEEPVITPVLDRLAQESLVLPQACSNYPLCSPYRAMMLTGQYAHATGVLENCNSETAPYDGELRTSARCWSDVLKGRSYSLGYIGKWHLDVPRRPYVDTYNNTEQQAWNEWTPPARRHGFDFWYAYGTFDRHMTPEYWTTDAPRDRRVRVNQWGPEHEADMAIRYIRNDGGTYRKPNRPFALVVAMNPPHMPYDQVPPRDVERYAGRTPRELWTRANVDLDGDGAMSRLARGQIKNYFAMITGVDEQFGRILAALDEARLRDDTIVVFTSDHGNCLGAHSEISKNVPWEESMRVPFLIRWPGRIRPRRDRLLLSTPDICPTLLDLTGLASDVPKAVQGVSHARLFLTGQGSRPSSQLYLRVPVGQPAWGCRGARTERYTLAITRERNGSERVELYDRVTDPSQVRDIAHEQAELVKKLRSEDLAPWLLRTGDPWPAGRADARV
jgi:arylsulfatase A-like enzyme